MKGKISLSWVFLRSVNANVIFLAEINPVCAREPSTLGVFGKWTPAESISVRYMCETKAKLLCSTQMEADTEHFSCINLGPFLD